MLKQLTEEQIVTLLKRSLSDAERGLGTLHLQASDEVLRKIASYSSGDARSAYNALEVAASLAQQSSVSVLTDEMIHEAVQKRVLLYDKTGEEHYNLISALHKSVRNSDPDAALYWLGRMLEAGEDPLYVARRVVRMASRTSASPSPALSPSAWLPATPWTSSACPKAISRSPRPSSI